VPTSLARATTLAIAALVPLAVWPWADRPFSSAKLWLLLAGAGVALLASRFGRVDGPRRHASPRPLTASAWLPVVWLTSFAASTLGAGIASPDSLRLALAGPLWFAAILSAGVTPRAVLSAHVAGVTCAALVVIGQALGADPFALAGWTPVLDQSASERLRVFGTFGNPNFVASVATPTLVLAIGLALAATTRRHAAAWTLSAIMQAVAVAATGSRAGGLGLVAAAVVWVALGTGRHTRRAALAATLGATALAIVVGSTARPLGETLEGRIYIWRVAAPHVATHLLLGHGPGAFELEYAAWESEAWRTGRADAASARFRGPQPHAHNDYLEAFVDRGLVGAVTIVLLLTTFLRHAIWQRRAGRLDPLTAAGAAAAAVLMAIALVDFPLARPGDTALVWMLAATASSKRSIAG